MYNDIVAEYRILMKMYLRNSTEVKELKSRLFLTDKTTKLLTIKTNRMNRLNSRLAELKKQLKESDSYFLKMYGMTESEFKRAYPRPNGNDNRLQAVAWQYEITGSAY